MSEAEVPGPDTGADGFASLSRIHRDWNVGGGTGFRDGRLIVRRYISNAFDVLLHTRLIDRKQFRAAVWAMSIHGAGSFMPRVVARYNVKCDNDRDELLDDVVGDIHDAEDFPEDDCATTWRKIMSTLPQRPGSVLENLLLGSGIRLKDDLPYLREALDRISTEWLGDTK